MGFGPIAESLNAGLIVLTAAYRGERSGCLVGFHTQCSIDPPRYAVWLSKLNHTYRVAAVADHVAIHFLGRHDRDLAELFGGTTGDTRDKFEDVDWVEGPHGVPLLSRCQTRVVARRASYIDDGSDHVCMVCEPLEIESQLFEPFRLLDAVGIEPGHPEGEQRRVSGRDRPDDRPQ
jgi:flavin reductase (DIM6/NTAB) family NADH-FMN oxidoreductase RutF